MRSTRARPPVWLLELAGGWIYWLAFLLLLEIGNVVMALQQHDVFSPGREAGRILGASLLGALSAPPLLAGVRRFALADLASWRHLLLQISLAGIASVSLLLIGVVLGTAAGVPQRPSLQAEFSANGGLMFYGVLAFMAGGNIHQQFRRGEGRAVREPGFPATVTVRDGHKVRILAAADIDWIESQGNYVALHAQAGVFLARETLSAFEKRLDPAEFRRIHRGAIVRLSRIREISPLVNGDRSLILADGSELRASRTYRNNLP